MRIRDFLNTAIYSLKEARFIEETLARYAETEILPGSTFEVEEGISILQDGHQRRVYIDYEKNQFKFMPSNADMSLFAVSDITTLRN